MSAAPHQRTRHRVLIADDHAVVRAGLRTLLTLDPGLDLVGEAADGDQAVELSRRLRPDVVLMDVVMPGLDGIAATGAIRAELPEIEVVVFSGYLDEQLIAQALQAGAAGYLLKDVDLADLPRMLRSAAAGQVQLSPAAAARLVSDGAPPPGSPRLTRREEEILSLLARGAANRQIARELQIGQQTVKTHVSSILTKLNVRSRTEAARYAFQLGLVPLHGG